MRVACAIRSRDLARLRVMVDSLVAEHPEATVQVTAVDAGALPLSAQTERFEHVPAELLANPRALADLRLAWGDDRASFFLGLRLVSRLLAADSEPVVVLDSAALITGRLDRLRDAVLTSDIALVPRFAKTPPIDAKTPSAEDLIGLGVYDPGLIAFASRGQEVLDWFSERAGDPRSEFSPRDLELLPGSCSVELVHSPGLGVAYWNLHERTLGIEDGTPRADGEQVAMWRFPGFDPERAHLLAPGLAGERPRILMSEQPILRQVASDYAERLRAANHEEIWESNLQTGALLGGVKLDRHMRRAFRDHITSSAEEAPPNPIAGASPHGFYEWLNESPPRSADRRVSRYLLALWADRDDLRGMFPEPLDGQAELFLEWIAAAAREQEDVPANLMPAIDPVLQISEPAGRPSRGVNLVGFLSAGFGGGEAARLMNAALERTSTPHSRLDLELPGVEHSVAVDDAQSDPEHSVNLVCVNVDWMHYLRRRVEDTFFSRHYTIGVWCWESTVFPDSLQPSFELVDEIWVHSPFEAEVMSAQTDRPVLVFPQPVSVPETAAPLDRAALGIPDGFMFLFSFDFNSTIERKNPEGLIEAYRAAFAEDEGAVLVLKSIHGERHLDDLEYVRSLTEGRDDIVVIDRFLDSDQRDALTVSCDCYVSLHRSEGFGLTIAEAMALGRPTIATGYSGNLAFQTVENSLLVDHRLVTLTEDSGPYAEGTVWAEPDLGHAARLMRGVFEEPERAARIAKRGREDVQRHHSLDALTAFLEERLPAALAEADGRADSDQVEPAQDDSSVPAPFARHPGAEQLESYLAGWRAANAAAGQAKKAALRAASAYAVPQDHYNELVVQALDDDARRLHDLRVEVERDRGMQNPRLDRLEQTARQLTAIAEALDFVVARHDVALREVTQEVRQHRRLLDESVASLADARSLFRRADVLELRAGRTEEQARIAAGRQLRPALAEIGPDPGGGDEEPLTGFELRVRSQNGEDGVIAEILRRIGSGSTPYCIEFGVETGEEANTVALMEALGWPGLLIEADADSYATLADRFAAIDAVQTLHAPVTADNVEALFGEASVPGEPAVLSIDVDGNDYWIWEAVEAYRPRLLVIEYNAQLPMERALVQVRDDQRMWDGTDGYGASLGALERLAQEKGYRLVHTDSTGVNAFFVRLDLADGFVTSERVPRHSANHFWAGGRHPKDPGNRPFLDLESNSLVRPKR